MAVNGSNKRTDHSEDKKILELEIPVHVDAPNFEENLAGAACHSDTSRNEFIDTLLTNSGFFDLGQNFINITFTDQRTQCKDNSSASYLNTQAATASADAEILGPTSPVIQHDMNDSTTPEIPRDFTELEVGHQSEESVDSSVNHDEMEYVEREQTTILTDPLDESMHYEVENHLLSIFLKTNGRQVNARKRKSKEHLCWLDSFWTKKKKKSKSF